MVISLEVSVNSKPRWRKPARGGPWGGGRGGCGPGGEAASGRELASQALDPVAALASVPAERDRARLGGRGDTALIRRRLRQRRRLMAPVGPCRRWAASAGAARPGARGPCGCRGRCPGVRAKATGRPVTQGPGHGPCWSRPPARGRPPPARPPCCGLRRAMSLDAGACDAGPLTRGL